MDIVVFCDNVQGLVVRLRDVVDSVLCLLAAVVAGLSLSKDGGRHVESGGLAYFSRDERPFTSLYVNGTCLAYESG